SAKKEFFSIFTKSQLLTSIDTPVFLNTLAFFVCYQHGRICIQMEIIKIMKLIDRIFHIRLIGKSYLLSRLVECDMLIIAFSGFHPFQRTCLYMIKIKTIFFL